MKRLGIFVRFLLAILTIALVAGCTRSGETIPPNTLRYALEQEPSTLDPAKSSTLPESTVELAVFEGLTRLMIRTCRNRLWLSLGLFQQMA